MITLTVDHQIPDLVVGDRTRDRAPALRLRASDRARSSCPSGLAPIRLGGGGGRRPSERWWRRSRSRHDAPRTAFDHTLRIDAFGNGARLLIFAAGPAGRDASRWACAHLADRAVEYHALLLAARRRHVAAGGGEQPGDRVHRAGAVLDLRCTCWWRSTSGRRCRAWRARLKYLVVGSVGAAFLLLRIGAGLRRDRAARVRPDRAVDPRTGDAHGGVLLLGIAMMHRRARVQGERGAVPHVDARRVRGGAHPGNRVHVGGHQDGRAGR